MALSAVCNFLGSLTDQMLLVIVLDRARPSIFMLQYENSEGRISLTFPGDVLLPDAVRAFIESYQSVIQVVLPSIGAET